MRYYGAFDGSTPSTVWGTPAAVAHRGVRQSSEKEEIIYRTSRYDIVELWHHGPTPGASLRLLGPGKRYRRRRRTAADRKPQPAGPEMYLIGSSSASDAPQLVSESVEEDPVISDNQYDSTGSSADEKIYPDRSQPLDRDDDSLIGEETEDESAEEPIDVIEPDEPAPEEPQVAKEGSGRDQPMRDSGSRPTESSKNKHERPAKSGERPAKADERPAKADSMRPTKSESLRPSKSDTKPDKGKVKPRPSDIANETKKEKPTSADAKPRPGKADADPAAKPRPTKPARTEESQSGKPRPDSTKPRPGKADAGKLRPTSTEDGKSDVNRDASGKPSKTKPSSTTDKPGKHGKPAPKPSMADEATTSQPEASKISGKSTNPEETSKAHEPIENEKVEPSQTEEPTSIKDDKPGQLTDDDSVAVTGGQQAEHESPKQSTVEGEQDDANTLVKPPRAEDMAPSLPVSTEDHRGDVSELESDAVSETCLAGAASTDASSDHPLEDLSVSSTDHLPADDDMDDAARFAGDGRGSVETVEALQADGDDVDRVDGKTEVTDEPLEMPMPEEETDDAAQASDHESVELPSPQRASSSELTSPEELEVVHGIESDDAAIASPPLLSDDGALSDLEQAPSSSDLSCDEDPFADEEELPAADEALSDDEAITPEDAGVVPQSPSDGEEIIDDTKPTPMVDSQLSDTDEPVTYPTDETQTKPTEETGSLDPTHITEELDGPSGGAADDKSTAEDLTPEPEARPPSELIRSDFSSGSISEEAGNAGSQSDLSDTPLTKEESVSPETKGSERPQTPELGEETSDEASAGDEVSPVATISDDTNGQAPDNKAGDDVDEAASPKPIVSEEKPIGDEAADRNGAVSPTGDQKMEAYEQAKDDTTSGVIEQPEEDGHLSFEESPSDSGAAAGMNQQDPHTHAHEAEASEGDVADVGLSDDEPSISDASDVHSDLIKAEPVEAEGAEAGPVETKPVEAEPVEAEPVEVEPVEVEAVEAEPVEAEPVEAEPVEAEPVEAEPVEAKPIEAEPVEVEPVEAEPVEAEAEPAVAEAVEAEPAVAEPVEAEPTENGVGAADVGVISDIGLEGEEGGEDEAAANDSIELDGNLDDRGREEDVNANEIESLDVAGDLGGEDRDEEFGFEAGADPKQAAGEDDDTSAEKARQPAETSGTGHELDDEDASDSGEEPSLDEDSVGHGGLSAPEDDQPEDAPVENLPVIKQDSAVTETQDHPQPSDSTNAVPAGHDSEGGEPSLDSESFGDGLSDDQRAPQVDEPSEERSVAEEPPTEDHAAEEVSIERPVVVDPEDPSNLSLEHSDSDEAFLQEADTEPVNGMSDIESASDSLGSESDSTERVLEPTEELDEGDAVETVEQEADSTPSEGLGSEDLEDQSVGIVEEASDIDEPAEVEPIELPSPHKASEPEDVSEEESIIELSSQVDGNEGMFAETTDEELRLSSADGLDTDETTSASGTVPSPAHQSDVEEEEDIRAAINSTEEPSLPQLIESPTDMKDDSKSDRSLASDDEQDILPASNSSSAGLAENEHLSEPARPCPQPTDDDEISEQSQDIEDLEPAILTTTTTLIPSGEPVTIVTTTRRETTVVEEFSEEEVEEPIAEDELSSMKDQLLVEEQLDGSDSDSTEEADAGLIAESLGEESAASDAGSDDLAGPQSSQVTDWPAAEELAEDQVGTGTFELSSGLGVDSNDGNDDLKTPTPDESAGLDSTESLLSERSENDAPFDNAATEGAEDQNLDATPALSEGGLDEPDDTGKYDESLAAASNDEGGLDTRREESESGEEPEAHEEIEAHPEDSDEGLGLASGAEESDVDNNAASGLTDVGDDVKVEKGDLNEAIVADDHGEALIPDQTPAGEDMRPKEDEPLLSSGLGSDQEGSEDEASSHHESDGLGSAEEYAVRPSTDDEANLLDSDIDDLLSSSDSASIEGVPKITLSGVNDAASLTSGDEDIFDDDSESDAYSSSSSVEIVRAEILGDSEIVLDDDFVPPPSQEAAVVVVNDEDAADSSGLDDDDINIIPTPPSLVVEDVTEGIPQAQKVHRPPKRTATVVETQTTTTSGDANTTIAMVTTQTLSARSSKTHRLAGAAPCVRNILVRVRPDGTMLCPCCGDPVEPANDDDEDEWEGQVQKDWSVVRTVNDTTETWYHHTEHVHIH